MATKLVKLKMQKIVNLIKEIQSNCDIHIRKNHGDYGLSNNVVYDSQGRDSFSEGYASFKIKGDNAQTYFCAEQVKKNDYKCRYKISHNGSKKVVYYSNLNEMLLVMKTIIKPQ